MNELKRALEWHQQAVPNPTEKNKCIAVGVHYEEVSEMMEALVDDHDAMEVERLAELYKTCDESHLHHIETMGEVDKIALLDALADQIVTVTGVANAFGFDIIGALAEVNRSNFSKFENDKPVFDKNGKITKGKHYSKPDLKAFI